MDDLQTVCQTMLDNADMDVEFTDVPFTVRLTFYVVGMDKKVVFECANIASFHLTKDADEDPLYVVLETRVTEPRQRPAELSDREFSLLDQTDYLWRIDIEAAIDLRITSRDFSWRVEQMSEEELHRFTAPVPPSSSNVFGENFGESFGETARGSAGVVASKPADDAG